MPIEVKLFWFSMFALLGHGARNSKLLEWFVRIVMVLFFIWEAFVVSFCMSDCNPWMIGVALTMCLGTGLILFIPVRKIASLFFTALDSIVSLRFLTNSFGQKLKVGLATASMQPIFIPTSIPHMVGLFLYFTALSQCFGDINVFNFGSSTIYTPAHEPLFDDVMGKFSYNGFALIMVSLCGVGVCVSRNWRETFKRLGWEKATARHIAIGLGLIAFSFAYDLIWSLYTHGLAGDDLAAQLAAYNASGYWCEGGTAGGAVIVALATALCAGIGEETLTRGALQPALGIVPAALLHGAIHWQFDDAPILIIQVTIWSICMGIVRKYTNTTTTIIGHCGYNLLTVFLFAFNP